jgi:D-alanyl-lipoteichoic acid acyltransferase DltB (MBOAT superfamily)
MLFNSATFIFGFLPLTLLGFFVAARWRADAAMAWLLAASLLFYAWWDVRWLPLMLGSIAFNLLAGRLIAARHAAADRAAQDPTAGPRHGARLSARGVLIAAIAADLLLLMHHKYAGFLASNLALLGVWPWPVPGADLPLGISFFTFTQIAFLVDVHQRRAHDFNPLRYGLFVTYFPHLIAGPILHHQSMMPQFARADVLRFSADRLADGSVLFILGLFKKTVLADAFGSYASPAFDAAAAAEPALLTLFEAWGAALAYTLQIYFDFSGYSDMAIGLAAMIGVSLPMNFDAPYRARNIADFWRRWHMTLSAFLRDYLYIPLGGNRHGLARQQLNLAVTMLLGGLWHGAGWTFVIWGGLHGLYLMVFHGWQRTVGSDERGIDRPWLRLLQALSRLIAWPLTFLCVIVAWVFFRAADLDTAFSLLKGMAGLQGSVLPEQIIHAFPALACLAQGAPQVPYLGDGSVMGAVEMLVMLSGGMALAVFAPALHELRNRTRYLLVVPCAALVLQQVVYGRASPFLYFQF